MSVPKNIVVIARVKKAEALRMAGGLTLLDDVVRVFVVGELNDDAETAEQLEALEFAEVPIVSVAVDDRDSMDALASTIAGSQVVYIV
ncbi:MAG: hypothetical protein GC149_14270 [Gammaproteobacteria bacterium]|nr:hypothetical protein [Gammaproteobacteria bacterium]